ncbi:MAG: DUF2905 domain-containing protein [Desulfuromonadaceae bacterium]|jgi:hypothetical protein
MPLGKVLMILGGVLFFAGLFLSFGDRIPWLGRLPGDIQVVRKNVSFYFPIGTCLLISALLSLLFWLFRR